MKTTKVYAIILAAVAAVLCSCSKQETVNNVEPEGDLGSVNLSLFSGDAFTKANANTNESTLSDVQVFLFNTAGELYRYYALEPDEKSSKSCTISNLKTGTYSMHVVANGPGMSSNIHNKAELLATAIELGAYNNPASDFVMAGFKDNIEVSSTATADVAIEISRFVSRVTLSEITNKLPKAIGDMKVNYAVLSNVVANQTISGSASAATWYNKDGRADESTRDAGHIIGTGSYGASAGHDTYASYSQDIKNGATYSTTRYFYAYPNSLTTHGTGFQSTYSPVATCLDLSISFKAGTTDHTYYYNVPLQGTGELPGIARNYDYDVKVTISGQGADEPGKYVEKGSISATITVKGWSDGASTTIEI